MEGPLGDVALSAPEYSDDAPFDEWMEERISGVMEVLLEEDREEELKALPPEEPMEDRFRCLVETLGIEPGLSRKACNVANRLEDGVRHAFFAMIVERKSVDEFASEYGETRERAKTLVHRALLAVSLMNREEEEDG